TAPFCLDLPRAFSDGEPCVLATLAPSRTPWLTILARAFAPEGRARRVTILLVATALMCLGDLTLTMTYITSMGMVETNPIARAVMASNSPGFVVVWKLTTMALGLGIL